MVSHTDEEWKSGRPVPPPERKPSSREVVYQDRLRDESHKRDDTITWAVAPLVDASSKRVGAVLVAFDMTRINEAARAKYLKFFGMVIFFVGLILLQNIASRRDKLRLLDIEARHRGTKEALRKALPEGPTQVGALAVQGVLEQARGCVDGMVWDVRAESTHAPKETNGEAGDAGDAAGDEAAQANALTVMIVDPDGDGIDAAAVGLHTLRSFRNQTRSSERLSADVVTVGATIAGIPLARPIAILLLRVHESGDFCAQLSDFAEIYLVDGNGAAQRMKLLPEDGEVPPGIVGPLRSCSGTLPVGSTLIVASAGKGIKAAHVDAELLTRHLSRQFAKNTKNGATGAKDLDALALFLRAKQPALSQNDIAVVAVHRA